MQSYAKYSANCRSFCKNTEGSAITEASDIAEVWGKSTEDLWPKLLPKSTAEASAEANFV